LKLCFSTLDQEHTTIRTAQTEAAININKILLTYCTQLNSIPITMYCYVTLYSSGWHFLTNTLQTNHCNNGQYFLKINDPIFTHSTPYISAQHTLHFCTAHPTFLHSTPYISAQHTLHFFTAHPTFLHSTPYISAQHTLHFFTTHLTFLHSTPYISTQHTLHFCTPHPMVFIPISPTCCCFLLSEVVIVVAAALFAIQFSVTL
jgi:hypothetical protein